MDTAQLTKLKEEYITLLRSTQRPGIESVISWLEQSDFFTAPASTAFHGNYPGGLLEHSLNVAKTAIKLREMLDGMLTPIGQDLFNQSATPLTPITRENLLIAGLLHDICKANIYKQEKKNRKVDGRWEEYIGYGVDYSELPLGHGEKSVVILLRLGLELTTAEMLAIRWHMGAWDLPFQSAEAKGNINAAKENAPLLALIQAADGLSTSILESQK